MSDPEPSREWQRGLLATCVLAVLAEGETHGYAIAQRLQKAGIGPLKGGALYPVLNRLEDEGAVASHWREGDGGPGRKVFAITAPGRERLAGMHDGWPGFASAIADLLAARQEGGPSAAEGADWSDAEDERGGTATRSGRA